MRDFVQALSKDTARLIIVLGVVVGFDAASEWTVTRHYTGGGTLTFLRAVSDFCGTVEPKYALVLFLFGGLLAVTSVSCVDLDMRQKRLSKSQSAQLESHKP